MDHKYWNIRLAICCNAVLLPVLNYIKSKLNCLVLHFPHLWNKKVMFPVIIKCSKVGGWEHCQGVMHCEENGGLQKNVQVLSVCKRGQVVLAKDESWRRFLGVKPHDSLAGINFYQLGKMAEPPIDCRIEDEVKSLEALPALCQWCSSPGDSQSSFRRTSTGLSVAHRASQGLCYQPESVGRMMLLYPTSPFVVSKKM